MTRPTRHVMWRCTAVVFLVAATGACSAPVPATASTSTNSAPEEPQPTTLPSTVPNTTAEPARRLDPWAVTQEHPAPYVPECSELANASYCDADAEPIGRDGSEEE